MVQSDWFEFFEYGLLNNIFSYFKIFYSCPFRLWLALVLRSTFTFVREYSGEKVVIRWVFWSECRCFNQVIWVAQHLEVEFYSHFDCKNSYWRCSALLCMRVMKRNLRKFHIVDFSACTVGKLVSKCKHEECSWSYCTHPDTEPLKGSHSFAWCVTIVAIERCLRFLS